FLANMNRLMESTITADIPSTDGVGMEIASASVENSEWVVQMEASAERVSSVASGEASFAGSTQTVPALGDRMNGISPGCPQPQHNAGCLRESNQVADMACSLSAGPDGTSKQDSPSSANTNHNEDGKCLATETATLNLPLLVQKKRKSFAPLSRVDPPGRQATGMCSPCELSPEGKLDQCNGTAPVHETLAGIGVQVKRERGLVSIVDMMPGGPAAKVLKKGQVVLQIDGQSISDLPIRDVLAKFRGRPGSVVLLSVVDGVAAHQAGQESRTVGIQRFSSVRSSQDRESLQKQNTWRPHRRLWAS
ncbi:MAG: PDZ domain-containing protein, partial [Promethearchaeia archaeon]